MQKHREALKARFLRMKEKVTQHKILLQNFSYLSLLQLFNVLLPLLIYPFLIRALGKDVFGLVVYAQAVASYFLILVSFGFNTSATRSVSLHRNDKVALGGIISTVLQSKVLLLVLSMFLLAVLWYFVPIIHSNSWLFFLSMWVCVYDAMFPIWYFQGTEKMKYITWITLSSRLLFMGLMFLFIHTPTDYLLVPIFNGIGAVLAGLLSLYVVFGRHKNTFRLQSINALRMSFVEAWTFFISQLFVNLYVNTNKLIIGTFLGMTELSYFDLAEKIRNVMKTPQGILSQSLFPKLSREKNVHFIRKSFWLSLLFNLLLFALVYCLTTPIILLLGGTTLLPAEPIVRILMITIPIIGLSDVLGIQTLVSFGYDAAFRRINVLTAIFYLALIGLLILLGWVSLESVSFVVVASEVVCLLGLSYYIRKYGLHQGIFYHSKSV